jgi:hypothetical protein
MNPVLAQKKAQTERSWSFVLARILSDREGMLYYLTGFERSEVDLLVKRFGEVKICGLFRSCSSLRGYVPLLCLLF